jgi:hypothetical protein
VADTRFLRLSDAAVRTQPRASVEAAGATERLRPATAASSTVAVAAIAGQPELVRPIAPAADRAFASNVARTQLSAIRPDLVLWQGGRFTRENAQHPISPVPTPSDIVLYEDPRDAAKRYYLPRYRLREDGIRYEVAVDLGADGLWAVRFGLQPYPAEEIAADARTADPLAHTLSAAITYQPDRTRIQRRLPADLQEDAKGYVCILRLTLEERDSLLRAFRSDVSQAQIEISRSITVSVPAPEDAQDGGVALPRQAVVMRPMDLRPNAAMVAANPALTRAARPTVTVRARPSQVWLPRDGDVIVADPAPVQPAPVAKLYQVASPSLNVSVPLRFDPQEHPYIFATGGDAPVRAEFKWIPLPFPASDPTAHIHSYYQDVSHPNRFFYLPDAFKLARVDFLPALTFRIDQGDDSDPASVDLTCVLHPYINGSRLMAAKEALKAEIPVASGVARAEVELQPLRAAAKLRLGLPKSGIIATQDIEADIDLANGFVLYQRIAFDDFQDVFAALNSPAVSTLLRGNVMVSTGLASDDQIQVEIRFGEMAGEVFEYSEQTDPQTATVNASLRNATESALRIAGLQAWLERVGTRVAGRIEGLDPARPADLAPDASLQLRIVPTAPLPGEGTIDAIFDTTRVETIPDAARILSVVLDRSIAQECLRPITVMTAADSLSPPEAPGEAKRLIVVEFRGNRRVILDSSRLEAEVEVPVPLIDVLLRTDDEGKYEYKQTIIYKDNRQLVDPAWRKTTQGLLFVPIAS